MKVSSIDLGSNSVRLLIGEWDGEYLVPVLTRLATTRLGAGMEEGRLAPSSVQKTLAVLGEYKEIIEANGAGIPVIGATSAVRDAADAAGLARLVREETGWELWVMSGEEEAVASYTGAVRGLAGRALQRPLVLDIGGGSTEAVWREGERLKARSVRAGAVRMTENGDNDEEIERVLSSLFDDVPAQVDPVGVGGTMTTLASLSLGLMEYDSNAVHGYFLSREEIFRLLEMLSSLTVEERRKMPGLAPARADIIVAGAMIVAAAAKLLGAPGFTVSDRDILHGLVYLKFTKKYDLG